MNYKMHLNLQSYKETQNIIKMETKKTSCFKQFKMSIYLNWKIFKALKYKNKVFKTLLMKFFI